MYIYRYILCLFAYVNMYASTYILAIENAGQFKYADKHVHL